MKKNLTSLLVFLSIIALPYGAFADCKLDSEIPKDVKEYVTNVKKEINEIGEKMGKEGMCEWGPYPVDKITNLVKNQQKRNDQVHLDGNFNTALKNEGTMKYAVQRDYNYLKQQENEIEKQIESLVKKCGTNSVYGPQLIGILMEFKEIKTQFMRTGLAMQKATPTHYIRKKNEPVFKTVSVAYYPSQTQACKSTAEYKKATKKSLKYIISTGWSLENALKGWERGAALFAGGKGLSESEYINIKQKVLMEELSRQGAAQSTRKTILNNFDCYKSKTPDGTQIDDMVSARTSCLSNPISGLDKKFAPWRQFVWKSKTLQEYHTRTTKMLSRKSHDVDILKMYNKLDTMTSRKIDIDQTTLYNLISLHTNLISTNTLLEKRIPIMQKNCMKGQPNLVGGCR